MGLCCGTGTPVPTRAARPCRPVAAFNHPSSTYLQNPSEASGRRAPAGDGTAPYAPEDGINRRWVYLGERTFSKTYVTAMGTYRSPCFRPRRFPAVCPVTSRRYCRIAAETLATRSVRCAFYSSRSRIIGSTARACRAGIHAASRPTNNMVRVTPPSTIGSLGVAW
jgi:hypothetical protein